LQFSCTQRVVRLTSRRPLNGNVTARTDAWFVLTYDERSDRRKEF